MLLVRQLQHGFTKNATKVSPNLTVAHLQKREGRRIVKEPSVLAHK